MKKNYANPDLGISQDPFERPLGDLGVDLDCIPVYFDFPGDGEDFDEDL